MVVITTVLTGSTALWVRFTALYSSVNFRPSSGAV